MKKFILTGMLLGACGWSLWAQETPIQEEPPASPEVEPLMRGPIHEAYAEPIADGNEEAFVVPEAPPAEIEEIPPGSKPEGDRVTWIGGYWSWDSEISDYIWVSGVWRKVPAGRTWSPGRWEPVDGGYQWIAGRWLADGERQTEILPAPPPTLERGPTSEAESEDTFWVPGSWQYRDHRYAWRPGFWSPSHANWVWVPDHYVTAVNGCYFVPGYWDYPWEGRGTLYAPCYINRGLAFRPGFRFSPSVVVDVSGAFFHLWVRPGYRHYYFGDYYGPQYASFGFHPWYNYPFGYRHGFGYDPLFSFYYWSFRRNHNIDLHRHLHHRHHHYQRNVDARPPHRHHRGPDRRGRNDVLLAGVEREALVRRVGERETQVTSLGRRDAIRRQVLEQHRERVRTGGESFADAPERAAGLGRGRGEGRSNADVQLRGAGRNRAGAGVDRQAGAFEGVRRARPNDATARSGDDRNVRRAGGETAGPVVEGSRPSRSPGQARGGVPAARGQAADRAVAGDQPQARPRSVEGAPRNQGGMQSERSPGSVDIRRRRPNDAVNSVRAEASRQAGAARPVPESRPPSAAVRGAEPNRSVGRAASPESGAMSRPPRSQPLPNRATPRGIPDSRPRPSGGPAAPARRPNPVPTNRSFSASGRAPSAGPAMRSAPRPSPQVSRPAPRPSPQVSRPAPAVRPAPSRGPGGQGGRSQQIQGSLNRRGGPRGN